MLPPPDFLVCGLTPAPDAKEGLCSRCGITVWPTTGSLVFAKAQNIPLLCLYCAAESKDYEFGGVIYHGHMVSGGRLAAAVARAMDRLRRAEGKEKK